GAASNYSGPAGATYTLLDSAADYGSVASGATSNCASATGNCYEIGVSSPSVRPSTHWDAMLVETLSTGERRGRVIHVGESFTDVPRSHIFYSFIERILHNGVTVGCTTTTFCPEDDVIRLHMAAFLARAKAGGDGSVPASGTARGQPYNCAPGGTSLFSDVAA